MKIVGGTNKGTRLRVSKKGVRPTKAIVREAIFNIVGNLVPDADVLDIFAGSGALGLEALSRGARHCVFIDTNIDTLKKNIIALRLEERSRIIKANFTYGIRRLKTDMFDIIFLDPPYYGNYIEKTMTAIARYNILQMNGIVVAEHGSDEDIHIPSQFSVGKKRMYGDTAVLFISPLAPASGEHAAGAPLPERKS
jgi:16S rRNA (guanine966-N2)-methyltransferase